MNVEQCMTRDPRTCHVGDTLEHPAQIMWEHDCGYVPVIDDRFRLCGVITDRDICMAAYTQGRKLSEIQVSQVMAREVHSCQRKDTLETAEKLMRARQVRRLPVIDEQGRLAGVLSLNDLARTIVSDGKSKSPTGDLTATLAAICQPRKSNAGGAGRDSGKSQASAKPERDVQAPLPRKDGSQNPRAPIR